MATLSVLSENEYTAADTARGHNTGGVYANRKVFGDYENAIDLWVGLPQISGDMTEVSVIVEKDSVPYASDTFEVTGKKFHVQIRETPLPIGNYSVTANWVGASSASEKTTTFEVQDISPTFSADFGISAELPIDTPQIEDFTGSYPISLGIPFTQGFLTSANLENLRVQEGEELLIHQQHVRATWPDGSVKWMQIYWMGNYTDGSTPETKLVFDDAYIPELGEPEAPSIGNPYLIDQRGLTHQVTLQDPVVLDHGPLFTLFEYQGKYAVQLASDPQSASLVEEQLCNYRIFLKYFPEHGRVDVCWSTILAYDTRTMQIQKIAWDLSGLPSADIWQAGADGSVRSGSLSPTVTRLHQQKHDLLQEEVGTTATALGKSDGWFYSGTSELGVTLLVRDFWQKYPKAVEINDSRITLLQWPGGKRVFTDSEEEAECWKLLSLHHGPLDMQMSQAEIQGMRAFNNGPGDNQVSENLPEQAATSNGNGASICTNFSLILGAPESAPALAAAFQKNEPALAPADYVCGTGACGLNIASFEDDGFSNVHHAAVQAVISHLRCTERGDFYGQFNYGESHHTWLRELNRPSAHRLRLHNHYGMPWITAMAAGNRELYSRLRIQTDYNVNVSVCHHEDLNLPFHRHMAKWHKGFYIHHGEAPGMQRRDDWSSRAGHFMDPDTYFYGWILGHDLMARAVFRDWTEAIISAGGLPISGRNREATTALNYAISAYQNSGNVNFLPYIHKLATSMLGDNLPGYSSPMFYPYWVSRYYEQFRDNAWQSWITLNATEFPSVGQNGRYAPLLATAYDITQDPGYLAKHDALIEDYPHRFIKAPGDFYYYGGAPGIGVDQHFLVSWPYFYRALKEADVETTSTVYRGSIPTTPTTHSSLTNPASLIVRVLNPSGDNFNVTLHADSFGGDVHPHSIRVLDPNDVQIFRIGHESSDRWPAHLGNPYSFEVEATDPGIYTIQLRGHQMQCFWPLTSLTEVYELHPSKNYYMGAGVWGILASEPGTLDVTIEQHHATVNGTELVKDMPGHETTALTIPAGLFIFNARGHNRAKLRLNLTCDEPVHIIG